mgnify:CR=1 FL=1
MKEATKLKVINYFWIAMTVVIAICTVYVSIFTIRDTIRTRIQIRDLDKKIAHYEAKIERDSIHVHDSVYIYLQGDTVYEERWKTIYKEVFRTDTFLITKTDTINHIVEVEKKLTKWQQTKMDVGAGVLYAVPILIAVGLYILYRKLKK